MGGNGQCSWLAICSCSPMPLLVSHIGSPSPSASADPPTFKRSGAAMAGSVNKVILIGNLGADPEIKSFQNGGKIANIRIATSEQWKDRMTGERKERTEWHNVV